MSEKEIIEFYDKWGDSEKSNCYLLNNYGLQYLPFVDIDTNTVCMHLMGMCARLV